jgi:maltose/moltooligosaccharide transporter
VQFFCWAALLYMWSYVVGAVSETVWNTDNPETEAYQTARNWTGVLYAIQALSSVLWAMLIPRFSNMKIAYSVSILLGALGFALIPFCPNQYLQIVPFLLIGCAWAAMLAMPFTFVTNALQGYGHMGAYLGLFNGTICLPQIIAAVCGGTIFTIVGGHQSTMMIVSGVLLVIGSCCVSLIKK